MKHNADTLKRFYSKYLVGVYIVVLAGKHALQLENLLELGDFFMMRCALKTFPVKEKSTVSNINQRSPALHDALISREHYTIAPRYTSSHTTTKIQRTS